MYKIFKSLCLIFILLLSLAASPVVPQEKILQDKAKGESPEAWLEYGKYLLNKYYEGESKHKEYKDKAAKLIKKAADAAILEAIFYLGYANIGDKEPSYYYEQAARQGYARAFTEIFDINLFRNSGDIKKAKEFADLARQKGLTSEEIYRDLDIVDICYQAGIPKVVYGQNEIFGNYHSKCGSFDNNENYKECILKHGHYFDIANLYANGWFISQDFWKAISYICHATTVPAELTSAVRALFIATKTGHLEEKFNYCDHASSSQTLSICMTIPPYRH